MIIDKYKLKVSNSFKNGLYKFEKYYASLESKEQTIYSLNDMYQIERTLKLLGLKSDKKAYRKMIEEFDPTSIDELSKKSFEILKSCEGKTDAQIKKSMMKTIEGYYDKKYDLESLIIFLNLYDDRYIKCIDAKLVDQITEYCVNEYFKSSSYVTFAGFKISWLYRNEFCDEFLDFFQNKPQNEEGFVPTIAQIKPTYRRVFQYTEISHVLDTNGFVDQATVYELCEKIDTKNMMSDEYYYQTLLVKNYPELKVDIEGLKSAISKAEKSEINLSNFMSYFYLIKAGVLNKIDCKCLISKFNNFANDKSKGNYLIEQICCEEIDTLSSKKKFKDFSKQIEEYSGEGDIETYYQYAVYLKENSKNCPNTLREKIEKAILKYYMKDKSVGGFWSNPEFKYNDIAQTYECLFLKDFLLDGQKK